jgi:single-strand DNA-binding protein
MAADPELRFTRDGTAVANVRLVASSRKLVDNEWKDDKQLWIDGTAFKGLAENIAETLSRGQAVIAVGRLQTEEWTTESGDKRSKIALILDAIGPATSRAQQQRGGQQQQAQPQAQDQSGWNVPGGQPEEPPF